ncbi:MAG: lyase family protein [Acidimicrobiia bacterium]
MTTPPPGYLGAAGRVASGPAASLVDTGYRLEIEDAGLLHRGLGLADLAHLHELEGIGVVPPAAAAALGSELLVIHETPADRFPYDAVYGDAYNSRERELERRLGALAGWLHTGRTRREAGRIAFRIATRSSLLDLHDAVARFGSSLTTLARAQATAPWNDTTYLQPAQPSTFGHYLSGFAEQVTRDLERITVAHRLVNRSPAGVGGVAGSSIPLDRHRLSTALGFDEPAAHTRDAMWSVDWLTDVMVAATQAVITADRLAEDLEIFASPQFGYVVLSGSATRASVLLPQKRNPYALAVIRGGAGTLIGRTTGVMVTQRTPSARTDNWLHAYGEVLRSVDLARRLLILATDVVEGLEVDVRALTASAGANFSISADLTERLVLDRGLDYRTAYRVVGRAVADAVGSGGSHLEPGSLDRAAAALGLGGIDDLDGVLAAVNDPAALAYGRDVAGGSAPSRVEALCADVTRRIEASGTWADRARAEAAQAEHRIVETATRMWRGGADGGTDDRMP